MKNALRQQLRQLVPRHTVLEDSLPHSGAYVMLFWPLPDEVDTRPFIRRLYASGVHVVLPVVVSNDIQLRLYEGEESMQEGAFHIMEPQGAEFTALELISRCYVPGMAFTAAGERLGRGKGYYDRFLPRLAPHTELIGVCPSERLLPSLPTESHDHRVHRLIVLPTLFILCIVLGTLTACKSKTQTNNPAFVQVMDTTGAEDPYYYEGDSIPNEEEHVRHVNHIWQLRHQRQRTVRSPYLDRSRGIISVHDDLFKAASATTGWDWRLIAAQCYQESGFDPEARSGAGARGLMQIMPATARELGLRMEDIHSPWHNVEAAARYIRKLSLMFRDIRSEEERIHFTLGAYNGGYSHIRDAMALCQKYGGDPQRWSDVSRYVLALQQPRYYRDPVVRHGYMIGSETTDYVVSIVQRARQYGARMSSVALPPGWKAFRLSNSSPYEDTEVSPATPKKERPTNRFTRGNSTVLRPDELQNQPQ